MGDRGAVLSNDYCHPVDNWQRERSSCHTLQIPLYLKFKEAQDNNKEGSRVALTKPPNNRNNGCKSRVNIATANGSRSSPGWMDCRLHHRGLYRLLLEKQEDFRLIPLRRTKKNMNMIDH